MFFVKQQHIVQVVQFAWRRIGHQGISVRQSGHCPQFDAQHAPDAGHAADPVLSMLPAPARMHAAELRLVRLTLLSWVTMLVNFIVAGLLFALCLRAMEAMSLAQS